MDRNWMLGKVFVLRHAGFPFEWVEELGLDAQTLAGLDQLLECERRLEAAGLTPAALTALEKGQPVKAPSPRPPEWDALLGEWKALRTTLEQAWLQERTRLRARLHQRCGDEGIQGAVFFSNPSVYENSWRRYAQEPLRPENADARRQDRQAYTYLQRLCAKNETTSFFGPMGYGEILPDDRVSVAVVPSQDSRRRTFLAFWAITELSRTLQRDPALRAELTLRLNPMFELTSQEARCPPLGLQVPLSGRLPQLVALLGEGPLTVRAAADRLQLSPPELEREVLPLLRVACVLRGLPFATQDLSTFEALIGAVAALGPSAARDTWLAHLDGFSRRLTAFAQGTLEERRVLLGELEALFTGLTGKAARRGEGGVYEDRLVIYEEAASPFALQFGRSFGQRLAAALSDGLEVSARYGEQVQQGHRETVIAQLGTEGELDFLSYTVKTRPAQVEGTRFSPVPPLPVEDVGRNLQLAASDFPAAAPGARFALPDVCLGGAVDQPEQLQILLARVHHHLLLYSWLATFHPRPEAYRAVAERFVSHEPGVAGLTALSVRRRNKGFYAYPGRNLLQSVTDTNDIGANALSPSLARVRLGPEGPRLFAPDGTPLQLYFPLDDLSKFAPFAALGHPQVVHAPLKSGTGHTPQVWLGGAVYQRERWEVPTGTLHGLTGLAFHRAVHRLRRRLGLPRFVYGRTPAERKPYLFDLESPFAMELLRHCVAAVESVTFEEMLPGPDQLFLRDARGRYTFELRMQAERWTVTPPAEGC